jgi:hypothetical protein
MDRSTHLTLLNSFFLKGYRFTLRRQNQKQFEHRKSQLDDSRSTDLSIVITTFQERFEVYTIPLVESIRSVSSLPITIVINGNLESLPETQKLQKFFAKVSEFMNVYPVTFQTFQGCAKMWNTGIIHSRASKVLILNDDVSIIPEHFNPDIHDALSLLSKSNVLTLNASWSHFLIDKQCISDFGWFDEHFIGIGNEDGEYAERYSRITGDYIPTVKVKAFLNVSDSTRDLGVVSNDSKYSLFNSTLNQLRHQQPSLNTYVNPYPLYEWQNKMMPLLSERDVPSLVTAIQQNYGAP